MAMTLNSEALDHSTDEEDEEEEEARDDERSRLMGPTASPITTTSSSHTATTTIMRPAGQRPVSYQNEEFRDYETGFVEGGDGEENMEAVEGNGESGDGESPSHGSGIYNQHSSFAQQSQVGYHQQHLSQGAVRRHPRMGRR